MEATSFTQDLGETPCAPEGIQGRPFLDLEILEALTTLLEITVFSPPPVNITMIHANIQILTISFFKASMICVGPPFRVEPT